MALGTVEVFLLVAVFAPLFTGIALVDLLDRVDAPIEMASVAASWALVIVGLPVVGPALYFAVGRDQFGADADVAASVITDSHPVVA